MLLFVEYRSWTHVPQGSTPAVCVAVTPLAPTGSCYAVPNRGTYYAVGASLGLGRN
jgi:hypothetical protein